eukprot:m.118288 g.118288  ORF g.118288 m.118288 type:complete len:450 (+) comp14508_c0_seq1:268-1617(+)
MEEGKDAAELDPVVARALARYDTSTTTLADTGDETNEQLAALLAAQADYDAQAEIAQDYPVCYSERGFPIDMRPPFSKIAVAEAEYARLVAEGAHVEAVRVLVVRTTLIKFVYGDPSPRLARAYLTLAKAYWELRELPGPAAQHARTALDCWKRVGKTDGDLADPLASKLFVTEAHTALGTALHALGRAAEAEKALGKADRVLDSIDAAARPAALELQLTHSLARVCAACGKHDIACEFFRRAIEIARADTVNGKARLAVLFEELGACEGQREPARAVASLEHSRALHADLAGPDSEAAAASALALARAHIRAGDDARAEAALCEALEVYVTQFGPHDERTIQLNDELARLLLRCRRLHDAAQLMKRVLVVKTEVYGAAAVQTADAHQLCGAVRLAQGKLNHATKHLRTALKIYRHVYGPAHAQTMKTEKMLSAIVANKDDDKPRFSAY